MKSLRILLCDDHFLFMEGVSTVFRKQENGMEVVGEACDGTELCDMVRKLSPDVILLDIRMPRMNGIDTVKEIRRFDKKVRILMLTAFNDQDLVGKALKAGANGYLLKDAPVEQLVQAVRFSEQQTVQLSPAAAMTVAESEDDGKDRRMRLLQKEVPTLSRRKREVFQHLLDGRDNLETAEALFISEKTVRNHISSIYRTIGVKNRTQAMLWAISRGLV